MTDSQERYLLLADALKYMGNREHERGPKILDAVIQKMATIDDTECDKKCIGEIWKDILSVDPNSPARLLFGKHVRRWDAYRAPSWGRGSEPLTDERRLSIYNLLGVSSELSGRVDSTFPVAKNDDYPVVIATKHLEWYTPERQSKRSFYWDGYSTYLEEKAEWSDDSVHRLDEASTLVVERFSDPERTEIYPTKGLVVGYVQSGKTANFTAVAAKAADAGYRLIIILAGTLNILREQTQRRIDKELIGREILELDGPNHDYVGAKDWDDFISHHGLPSEQDEFDWTRLTGADYEYQSLKKGIEALEHKAVQPGRRFNDPANLHRAPVRLVVMKKIPSVLKKLNTDLQLLKTHLEDVPALIIDDESDQASVNTRKPTASEEKKRTATNEQIIRLVRILPRAQYVGYTATPFANVFIDIQDTQDLFPKDYIISLSRPEGYMGVSDFFDLAEDGGDLANDELPKGFQSKERSFIRDVCKSDEDDGNLPKAIRSFLLSGAIKLYRKANGIDISCRHHTMLVHCSTRQNDHESDARLVMELYDAENVGSSQFYSNLEELWKNDFQKVTKAQAPDVIKPRNFKTLKSYIDQCVSYIEADNPVRIVNGDSKYADQMPNFDKDRIWSILVGGTKLSRGYTVEGLTVSYYRRRIKTADTLMQVGRWFGFRRGYKDLVRLFLGRKEPDGKNKTMDLYAAFKGICRDEETFRKELRKYADKSIKPRIMPKDIPPVVPSHYLTPTARNKMYHAGVCQQNFSGQWKERVMSVDTATGRQKNAEQFRSLIMGALPEPYQFDFYDEKYENMVKWSGHIAEVSPDRVISFLEGYQWTDSQNLMIREIEFLKGKKKWDPEIDRWYIVLPQKSKSVELAWRAEGLELSVFRRSRVDSRSFKVFSERRHRLMARYLSHVENLVSVSDDAKQYRKKHTAVMLCYPVVDNEYSLGKRTSHVPEKDITIGFGVQFPENRIQTPMSYGYKQD